MKELRKRLKNYGFWSALLLGLLPLLLQACGIPLPINFPDIVNGVLGLLVMLGLLSNPTDGAGIFDKDFYAKLFGKKNE